MPAWLIAIFPKGVIWDVPAEKNNVVYITFDDGPHPIATPFVLEQLEKYNAKATFFCVGNNVSKYPEVYKQVLAEGHTTGNHTYNHVNAWGTNDDNYIENIEQAATQINSRLFRPPYGKIRSSIVKRLMQMDPNWKIYMWHILSADFDQKITPEKCLENVLKHIKPGNIIVFHDSEKAWERMRYALPRVLEYCGERGWEMRGLQG
jgi:peptidoglycan/xylan/chitin deacetylase (PgdA/CDA1 family)